MFRKNTIDLTHLLAPRSIAVIGASRHPKKIGHIVLKNLIAGKFTGTLYPINPETTTVVGLPCFPSVDHLPKIPDLAIIVIPAAVALSALEAGAKAGIKNFVILSAGFKEIGPEGLAREKQLQYLAHKYHLHILGPNCLGFLHLPAAVNATFGQSGHTMGNVRFLSQSGAIATGLFDWAQGASVGLETVITLGNKSTLNENDVLRHWLVIDKKRPPKISYNRTGLSHTRPIGMYLESIEHGEEFIRLASAMAEKHPLFLLKPGRSEAAQQAIQSHTGAVVQSDAVLDVALKKAGIIRCDGVEDMFDLTRVFAWEDAPKGKNVAIISNAGGPAVMATDLVTELGLTLAPLSVKTHEILHTHLPREANIANPIDVLGDALAPRYSEAVNTVLREKSVDALLVILTPQVMTEIEATAEIIAAASKKYHKPIVCSFMGGTRIAEGEKVLNRYRIPSFRYPERAVRALASMWAWRTWQITRQAEKKMNRKSLALSHLAKKRIEKNILSAKTSGLSALPNTAANHALALAGLTFPPSTTVSTLHDAEKFAKKYNYPVVLKISSPHILHKTEAHAVVTNIRSVESLRQEMENFQRQIQAQALDHKPDTTIIIQKQIQDGIEVIVGMKRDPHFGPVFLFGAGGVLAEILGDHELALYPLTLPHIEQLIARSKIGPILRGYRGEKPYALQALAKLIVKFSSLAAIANIQEIEINPIIVTRTAAWAVDGRIILNDTKKS